MSATYSKSNFIVQPTPTDIALRIRDINGKIKYTLSNPNAIFFNLNNTIHIRLDNNPNTEDIILDFTNKVEAIQALSNLNIEYAKIVSNYNEAIETMNELDTQHGVNGASKININAKKEPKVPTTTPKDIPTQTSSSPANFSKNNFIVPVSDTDVSLRIRDIKNNIRYTIVNNTNTSFINDDKNIRIRTHSESTDLIIDFSSKAEAIQALTLLTLEYAKIKKNFEEKRAADFIDTIGDTIVSDIKKIIFSDDVDADYPLTDGQNIFQLPINLVVITSFFINGVSITDYTFDATTKQVSIDSSKIGYDIEEDDEVLIMYY